MDPSMEYCVAQDNMEQIETCNFLYAARIEDKIVAMLSAAAEGAQ
jgi:hypothetical protein